MARQQSPSTGQHPNPNGESPLPTNEVTRDHPSFPKNLRDAAFGVLTTLATFGPMGSPANAATMDPNNPPPPPPFGIALGRLDSTGNAALSRVDVDVQPKVAPASVARFMQQAGDPNTTIRALDRLAAIKILANPALIEWTSGFDALSKTELAVTQENGRYELRFEIRRYNRGGVFLLIDRPVEYQSFTVAIDNPSGKWRRGIINNEGASMVKPGKRYLDKSMADALRVLGYRSREEYNNPYGTLTE